MSTFDNLRRTARRWLKALRAGDSEARARLIRAYPAAAERATLRDVQHALARERGHESWIALKTAKETLSYPGERALIERLLSKRPSGR